MQEFTILMECLRRQPACLLACSVRCGIISTTSKNNNRTNCTIGREKQPLLARCVTMHVSENSCAHTRTKRSACPKNIGTSAESSTHIILSEIKRGTPRGTRCDLCERLRSRRNIRSNDASYFFPAEASLGSLPRLQQYSLDKAPTRDSVLCV